MVCQDVALAALSRERSGSKYLIKIGCPPLLTATDATDSASMKI
jgi:hypothetical protein